MVMLAVDCPECFKKAQMLCSTSYMIFRTGDGECGR